MSPLSAGIELSLLVPTRGRRALAERMLWSAAETAADPSALEAVLYVDADDEDSARIASPIRLRIVRGPRTTMGRMTQLCFAASCGRRAALLNDDAVFRTPSWDAAVIDAFERHPDGVCMVYTDDGYYGRRVPTFPMLSRETIAAMGEIVPAEYARHGIDSHLADVFERLAGLGLQRSLYLDDVLIEHMNVAAGSLQGSPEVLEQVEDRRRYADLAGRREQAARALHARALAWLPARPAKASVIVYDAGRRPPCFDDLSALIRPAEAGLIGELIIVSPEPPAGVPPAALGGSVSFRRADRLWTAAVNAAARSARCGWLALLEGGARPRRGWLGALLRSAQAAEADFTGSIWLEPRTGLIAQAGQLEPEVGGCRGMDPAEVDLEALSRPRALEASGLLARKTAFEALGGFQDGPPDAQGSALCAKASAAGMRLTLSREGFLDFDPGRAVAGELLHA